MTTTLPRRKNNKFPHWFPLAANAALVMILALHTSGCSDGFMSVNVDRPLSDSATLLGSPINGEDVQNYGTAVGLYYNAIYTSSRVASGISRTVGLFTDELAAQGNALDTELDVRSDSGLTNAGKVLYDLLHSGRVQAQIARTALTRFRGANRAFIGDVYALEGYAELQLAEVMCSGVPLTSGYFGENITYTRGFSATEIYRHAITLFDSALAYGQDSTEIRLLASVGKGRALLNLGEYLAAASAVANIPVEALYIRWFNSNQANPHWSSNIQQSNGARMANSDGTNGLVWLAPTAVQQDPRIPVTVTNTVPPQFTAIPRQAKYSGNTTSQVIASGIEAGLIKAESQLKLEDPANGAWLQTLNALRATLRNSQGTRLLADMVDPGTERGRVDLLFRERAFWLYLTGSRLGDLRRLVRQYGRPVNEVYPYGIENGMSLVFRVPREEALYNDLYKGCEDEEP